MSTHQRASAQFPQDAAPGLDAIGQQPAAGICADSNLPPSRVLVVEDESVNRKLLGLMLGKAGLDVAMAENGQVAVQLATEQTFDVILMDMQMPVLDGYAATRQLREAGYTQPIIALTGHTTAGDRDKCLDAGCTSYLTKPFDREVLLVTLSRLQVPSSPGP